jgi:hypothetical protein
MTIIGGVCWTYPGERGLQYRIIQISLKTGYRIRYLSVIDLKSCSLPYNTSILISRKA